MTSRHPSPTQARAIAESANEAIRALNRGTHPADGFASLQYPNDVYVVLGSLTQLTERLPQLLVQLSAFLQLQLQQDVLDVDDGHFGGDPLGAVGTASQQLEHRAVQAARRLATALDAGRQAIAFVSHTGADPDRR